MPTSRLKEEIARILKEEGYISDFRVDKGEAFDTLVIELKYGRNRERVISNLRAGVDAGPPRVRRQGPSAAGAGRHGHGYPVDLAGPGDEQDGRRAGSRRRGDLLRLVTLCVAHGEVS